MTVYEAIMKRRTIRKFSREKIEKETLLKLVDCARMAAFGANMQPLKFAVIDDDEKLDAVFPSIKWAGYLADGAPKEGERPAAYIAVLGDKEIKPNGMFETDAGAAVTNMMLAAEEEGIATCWLGAIDRATLSDLLKLPEKYALTYLLALGYPAQKSKAVEMENGNVKYFIDENGTVNVPKRGMDEIIVEL